MIEFILCDLKDEYYITEVVSKLKTCIKLLIRSFETIIAIAMCLAKQISIVLK